MKKTKTNVINSAVITFNRRIYYRFFLEKQIEAGLALQGWEVKALRSSKADINDSYIILKDGEAFLFGANFTPSSSVSPYFLKDTKRSRKLLLNQRELNFLHQYSNQKGYTIIALSLYWKKNWCKVKIGVVKGKKEYDKRLDIREREWKINKIRIVKNTRNSHSIRCIDYSTNNLQS